MGLCPYREMLRILSKRKKPYVLGRKDLKGRKACEKARYVNGVNNVVCTVFSKGRCPQMRLFWSVCLWCFSRRTPLEL